MTPARPLSIVPLVKGKAGTSVPLDEGVTTLGRDNGNTICLPDPSVSRRHAEISRRGEVLTLQDLNSRNGVKVNGVPRRSAVIRVDDEFQIGKFTFQVARSSGRGSADPAPRTTLTNHPELKDVLTLTRAANFKLAGNRAERHRDTVYHFAYWLTEGFDESVLIEHCLPLLRQSLEGEEVQYYDAAGQLLAFHAEGRKQPSIKLAAYLAEMFQQVPEATVFSGEELRVHQRKADRFNYLTAPLRLPGEEPGDPCAFLVVLRPVDWNDYDRQDRVLLQTIAQLWARSLAQMGRVARIRKEISSLKRRAGDRVVRLLGGSEAMEKLRRRVEKVAATKTSVLLEGETGSGKEVVAQMIHDESPRAEAPFVKMNCAAIPEGLIESELFGHVKGAFTDARSDRRGKFEQADGGTLFLDEIGEMPAKVQAKVLRALENGEIEKLGSEKVQQVDVRIVAATHRHLSGMVERQEFRQDLYYRLSVVSVKVPALRDHLDDLDELADHFLRQFTEENGMAALKFSKGALHALKQHTWPGNVRELRNVVQGCAIEAEGTEITEVEVRMLL